MTKPLTKKQINNLITDRAHGMTWYDLGDKYHCSHSHARDVFNKVMNKKQPIKPREIKPETNDKEVIEYHVPLSMIIALAALAVICCMLITYIVAYTPESIVYIEDKL